MTEHDLIRHCLATLAYRGGKCLHGAPPSFVHFDSGGGKTPLKILGHICDLIDWTMSMTRGAERWPKRALGNWSDEVTHFHASLIAFDNHLRSGKPVQAEITRLLQGPIADAFTHVGQLAMLRRMSGSPVLGENYFVADIASGRLGPDQAPPVKPFL